MLEEGDVLEFQYVVDPKAKKVSMVQQFFADIESAATLPIEQNGAVPSKDRKNGLHNGPHSLEAGLIAIATAATAFVEPAQVGLESGGAFLCEKLPRFKFFNFWSSS